MNIKDVLLKVGGAVLKSVPMGGMIYDIVDAVSGDLDPNITGDEMVAKIATLPPDIQERIMSKQIDASLKKYETWADLHKKMEDSSPMSKGRTAAIVIFAIMLCIIILTLCGIFAADYVMNGKLPSMDMVLGAMAIPGMCLLVSFGVRSDKILDLVLSVAIKRMK